MLTQQQQEDYIKNPTKCPFCKSDVITKYGNLEVNDKIAWETICCGECFKSWDNVYTLSRIEF
jgi:hypothetical protein